MPMVLHGAAKPGRAALYLSGAIGGMDGPAMLYPRLGLEMSRAQLSVARIDEAERTLGVMQGFMGSAALKAGLDLEGFAHIAQGPDGADAGLDPRWRHL